MSSSYFPDPRTAAAEDGLLVYDARLSQERLIDAYRNGIFPWPYQLDVSGSDPEWIVGWFSPNPRPVLKLEDLKVSRRLMRKLRTGKFAFTVNHRFSEVVERCATVGNRAKQRSLPDLVEELEGLFRQGMAKSIEVYSRDSQSSSPRFCGGLYGISVGNVFSAESMFHDVSDASKAALCFLVHLLRCLGYQLIDIQARSELLERMGSSEIDREQFLQNLDTHDRDGWAEWHARGELQFSDVVCSSTAAP